MNRAEHVGIHLSGPQATVELIEKRFTELTEAPAEELWRGGGVTVKVTSCGCETIYKSRESFPEVSTRCHCKNNFFVKYTKDVTIVDLQDIKENYEQEN